MRDFADTVAAQRRLSALLLLCYQLNLTARASGIIMLQDLNTKSCKQPQTLYPSNKRLQMATYREDLD